jgi:fructokinase
MNLIIELGGTKINFFVTEKSVMRSKISVPTTSPDDFKDYVVSKFGGQLITKIILACFGPISFDSHNYGEILNTPKKFWRHVNIYDWLKLNVCADINLVTDVAMPAIGAIEKYSLEDSFFSYITIGTGIGGCNVIKGSVLQNEVHPEIGHMYLGRSDENCCEYHSHCFENQASGHYFSNKYNMQFKDIDPTHPGWLDLTNNLAILLYNLYAALGVECIVLGGGVIRQDMKRHLIDNLLRLNNSYLPVLNKKNIDQRLILNEASDDLSLLGGIRLLHKQFL